MSSRRENSVMKPQIQKTANRQYQIGSALLLLFSTPFIVWQMGIMYYSGTTMSLFGRTPILLEPNYTMPVIVSGYLVSILLISLFPRKVIIMERVAMSAALIATIGMLFPFPPVVITAMFYLSTFVCVFSIGVMCSIAAQHFTIDTTWRDGILSMIIGGIFIAVLQNERIIVDAKVFTILSVVLVGAQTVFYFIIPSQIEVTYIDKKNRTKTPWILFIGVWLISGFATFLICLASSFAENVRGGISVLYLSAAVMAVMMYLIYRRKNFGSVRVYGGFFAISVFGFVLAYLSLHVRGLQIVACILLGFVVVLANMWLFFAAVSFRVYQTKLIGVIGAAMGLVLAGIHAGLLEILRDNLPLLYGIYAVVSVALLLVYFFMEPYFLRMWSKSGKKPLDREKQEATHKQEVLPHQLEVLSQQERILAELILDGHTETSAAKMMNITLNTEKGYRKSIYMKLDIHSKRELFALVNKRQP